ncbi:SARP family transcriptional regulator [Paractinoplanes deccanensis]|uniref:SARP family transcriptional regulator n=1 Tax=Paractinoplanes deccanensis TaxID=113561 RepID=A0ABQ3YC01_9ACTN|nr:SARP family transcriptional regulator [Actinoplanes deccanensis]
MRFTVLGPVRAWRGDIDLDLGGRQQRLVLALLLARAGTVVGLDELVDAVWEQDPPTSAVNVVHRYIGTLRRLIEPDLPVRAVGDHLVRHAAGYQLRVGEDMLDLLRFRRLVSRARREPDAVRAVAVWTEALTLWHGPCAAGLERSHPTFVAIDGERSQALRDAADTALRAGQARAVIPALRQGAAWSPLDEPLQARLIAALTADGRQAEAVEAYQQVRRRLADELGIDPGPELAEAYDRLLHQKGAPATAAAPEPEKSFVPAQLPPDQPFFSGRESALSRATRLVGEGHRQGRSAVTLAVDGMPGIGKTTFAVHLGHRLAGSYPDGQLFADLRGFAAQGTVMTPDEALRGFLGSLGVPQGTLPAELHALAGIYRSMLAGRRMLVVLDNARDFEQVRHLLPSAPGSLAIVTSRVRITALVGTGGAHPVPLDLPSPHEVREALVNRLGAKRVEAEPAAVDEIIARTGRLPLAASVVVARAVSLPETPLADIAEELAAAGAGLDGFGADEDADLAAVFSWSYKALSPGAARMFRLLSLHPGPDVSVPAAASLAAVEPRAARLMLGELATHTLTQARSGRHTMHDLLRTYAADLAERHDSPGDRREALGRLFDHYRSGAYEAHELLPRALPPPAPPEPRPGVLVPSFAGPDEAMAWFDAERRVLGAIAAAGAPGVSWHVALTLQTHLQFTGRTPSWVATMRRGLAAAMADGDLVGQAHLHRSLAGALFNSYEGEEAPEHLSRAAALFERLGDRRGVAMVELNWAYVRAEHKEHDEAVRHSERALEMFRSAGDRANEARALRTLAGSRARLGHGQAAQELLRQTIALSWEMGDTLGAGHSWDLLASLYREMGRPEEAMARWEEAAGAYRKAGNPAALAEVQLAMGDACRDAGDTEAARQHWREALSALPEPEGPVARQLRDRLGDS